MPKVVTFNVKNAICNLKFSDIMMDLTLNCVFMHVGIRQEI